MMNRLRHPDVRNFLVYGTATALAAVLTLIQTRILWHSLKPADFGLWSLIDPMLLPAASLLLFGIEHSIVKQVQNDGLSLQIVTGALLATTLPITLLLIIVTYFALHLAFQLAYANALLITIAGEALLLIMQTALRATGAIAAFAAVLLSRNLLYIMILLFASYQNRGAPFSIGFVFLTRGGCVILVSLAATAALRPVLRPDPARYFDAVRYGFPLLLTIFIYSLTDMTDRWFLAEFSGVTTVGIYTLHLKIAAIFSQAIVIPFGLWFPPERLKHLKDPDGGSAFFIRVAILLGLICGYVAGAVWLARDHVLQLIAPGVAASPLILACCLGAVICLALSQALNVGLLIPGYTSKNVICNTYAILATAVSAGVMVPPVRHGWRSFEPTHGRPCANGSDGWMVEPGFSYRIPF